MDLKNIFLMSLLVTVCHSCIKYDDEIDERYRKQINHYKKGELLVYANNLKEYDSIKIVNLDSSSTSQGPSNLPFKSIYLEIEHIPNNYWNNGIVLRKSTKKYDSVANQRFFSIIKRQNSNNKIDDDYSFPVEYRDFLGSLNMQTLNDKKIDTIHSILSENKKLNDSSVIEVYWQIDKGMIGYKKNNGSTYKLVEK